MKHTDTLRRLNAVMKDINGDNIEEGRIFTHPPYGTVSEKGGGQSNFAVFQGKLELKLHRSPDRI